MIAATKVKVSGSEKKVNRNTGYIRHFLHKKCNCPVGSFWKFYVVVVQNSGQEM